MEIEWMNEKGERREDKALLYSGREQHAIGSTRRGFQNKEDILRKKSAVCP